MTQVTTCFKIQDGKILNLHLVTLCITGEKLYMHHVWPLEDYIKLQQKIRTGHQALVHVDYLYFNGRWSGHLSKF